MPHISKRFLQKNDFRKINKQFYKIVGNLVRSGKTNLIFDQILTKTERIMLSKRLAIVVMIDQGESAYAIEQILKVSTSTVTRLSVSYEKGEYDDLLKEIKSQNSFWSEITKIIPPKVGRNRFKNFLQFNK